MNFLFYFVQLYLLLSITNTAFSQTDKVARITDCHIMSYTRTVSVFNFTDKGGDLLYAKEIHNADGSASADDFASWVHKMPVDLLNLRTSTFLVFLIPVEVNNKYEYYFGVLDSPYFRELKKYDYYEIYIYGYILALVNQGKLKKDVDFINLSVPGLTRTSKKFKLSNNWTIDCKSILVQTESSD